jgi:hypothetical protein
MVAPRNWFPGRSVRRTAGGILLGVLVFGAYLAAVGVGDVRRVLWAVPTPRLVSLAVVGLVPLVLWGLGLRLVLCRLDRRLRSGTAVVLFAASGFLNAVTPFGQAGGDPITAVLFGRAIGTDFETGLAAIGSLNALNRIATVVLGLLGVGYLAGRAAAGGPLRNAAVSVAGLAVAAAVALVVGWRYRHRLLAAVAAGIVRVGGAIARLVPGFDPPTVRRIERRGYRFVRAVERLAADPVRLAVVFGLSVAGHLAVAAALYVALAALGVETSLAAVLLVIPIAKLGGVAPTPGGFGSAETLLAMLLVSTAGVAPPVAGAAVLLYRGAAFWLPTLVGGLVTGWIAVAERVAAPPPEQPRPGAGGDGPSARADVPAGSPSTVPRLLLLLAVALAVLVALAMHRRDLVVEPDSVVVHLTRDAAIVVAVLAPTWFLLHRLPDGWFG